MDWLDLQRLATALIMPLSGGLMLGVVGLVLVWRLRRLGMLGDAGDRLRLWPDRAVLTPGSG